MEFKGRQRAESYAECKSSSSVFKENHVKDYLSGYNQALKDSKAPEMLEMLEELRLALADGRTFGYNDYDRVEKLIKQATEI